MELTLETVNILFFLIPGFISSYIIDAIIVRQELSTAKRIVESLIFTFSIYIITNFIVNIELFAYLVSKDDKTTFKFSTNYKFLSTVLCISIALPIAIGTIIFYDLHMKLFRKVRITTKTSRDSVWQDIFVEQVRYIVIHLKDERRLCGWPLYYSNSPKDGYIYLHNYSWLDDENKYLDSDAHGILIKHENIEFIEFLQQSKEENKCKRIIGHLKDRILSLRAMMEKIHFLSNIKKNPHHHLLLHLKRRDKYSCDD